MTHSKIKIWTLASRPKTLWAGISPVIIGTAMAFADNSGHILSALCAFTGAVLIQIGTNFANDYFDYKKGADSEERTGPMRVTQAGLVKPSIMKFAFIITFLLAVLPGLYLVLRGGWPILLIGLLSFLFGILYTGGPYPLGYNGLGEIFVLLFFGLIAVGGTYYVQALEINRTAVIAGISPGLFSSAILAVNNLRDIKQDRKSGKKTLAVRYGIKFARMEYLFCLTGACLVPVIMVLFTGNHPYSVCSAVVILIAVPSYKTVFSAAGGERLNTVLADTGKHLLIFSVLFSAGWLI